MTRVLMEMSILEAAHLTDLVDQFAELIAETVDSDTIDDDEAVARPVSYTHLTLPTIYSV